MINRTAKAVWEGDLKQGQGQLELGSGAWSGPYSFGTRFADQQGTNPEELIGAAHAGCYAMALSADLGKAGFTPTKITTDAAVQLVQDGDGFTIDQIKLTVRATVPEIAKDKFRAIAEQTKSNCPVSKALAGPKIELDAQLEGGT